MTQARSFFKNIFSMEGSLCEATRKTPPESRQDLCAPSLPSLWNHTHHQNTSHPSTKQLRRCLASEIGQDQTFSGPALVRPWASPLIAIIRHWYTSSFPLVHKKKFDFTSCAIRTSLTRDLLLQYVVGCYLFIHGFVILLCLLEELFQTSWWHIFSNENHLQEESPQG